jgi:hypothetical protein
MQPSSLWVWVVLIFASGLLLSACGGVTTEASIPAPAKVEADGRITLTEMASQRTGIQTAPISEAEVGGRVQKVVPYAAVVYGEHGETWVYTNPEPLVFVRQPITTGPIAGDVGVLLEGPPVGTQVVTAGVAELWGIESGLDEGGH